MYFCLIFQLLNFILMINASSSINKIIFNRIANKNNNNDKSLKKNQLPPCIFEFNSSLISQGEVYSPNYPNPYPNNLHCRYEFYANENERVIIHVDDFQLEPPQTNSINEIQSIDFMDANTRSYSNSNLEKFNSIISSTTTSQYDSNLNRQCFYDFLDVFSTDGQGRIYWRSRHCGSHIESQIVSTSPNLFLVFQTDRMLNFRGFKLRFYFSFLNILPFVTQPNCGPSEIYGNGSVLLSPNYPFIFPANAECTWAITVEKHQNILIKFIDLNLNQPCDISSVSIWDGYVSDINKPDKLVCERLVYYNKGSMVYKSKSNRLVIRFIGNRNNEQSSSSEVKDQFNDFKLSSSKKSSLNKTNKKILNGFKLSWTAVTLNENCPEFQCKGGQVCIDSKNVLCQPSYEYCISKSLVCDGVLNCDNGDESDEKHCELSFLRSKLYLSITIIGGVVFSILTFICIVIHISHKDKLKSKDKSLNYMKGCSIYKQNIIHQPNSSSVEFSNNNTADSFINEDLNNLSKKKSTNKERLSSTYIKNSKSNNSGGLDEIAAYQNSQNRYFLDSSNRKSKSVKKNSIDESRIKYNLDFKNSSSYKSFLNGNDTTEDSPSSANNNTNNDKALKRISSPTYSSSLGSVTSPFYNTESKSANQIINSFRNATISSSDKNINPSKKTRKSESNLINKFMIDEKLNILDDGSSTLRRNSYTRAIFYENA
jgi:hypothetical protein